MAALVLVDIGLQSSNEVALGGNRRLVNYSCFDANLRKIGAWQVTEESQRCRLKNRGRGTRSVASEMRSEGSLSGAYSP